MRARAQIEDLSRQLAEARTRAAELEGELRACADRDPVTGLTSESRFRRTLEIECDRARRHGRPTSLAIIDVDGFREVNARTSHASGDRVLRGLAGVLRRHQRKHDLTARTGSDEFAVLLPETDVAGAHAFCQRALTELESESFEGLASGLHASAGVAMFDRQQTPDQLIGAANLALDLARSEGGGRVSSGAGPVGIVSSEQRDAVSALAVALLERDRYTGEHSESMVGLVETAARDLGLNSDEVDRVRAAALLHDIGKVAIPDHILHKQGKLSPQEWQVMESHTLVGERILRAIPGMGGVARVVRHEHERWDGKGYPDGLAGEEIPLGSRIILVADAYHAMTSDRPYRAAMDHAAAIEQLVANAGTQFDPAVVQVLVGQLYATRQAGVGVA